MIATGSGRRRLCAVFPASVNSGVVRIATMRGQAADMKSAKSDDHGFGSDFPLQGLSGFVHGYAGNARRISRGSENPVARPGSISRAADRPRGRYDPTEGTGGA